MQENKHLSCGKPSVKCTNCGGERAVSAGLMGLGLGGSAAVAQGAHGNCYLLTVCLISHNATWLRFMRSGGWNPSVSRLQGCCGKTMRDNKEKHLDHLFRLCGVVLWPRADVMLPAVRLWHVTCILAKSGRVMKLTPHEGAYTHTHKKTLLFWM